ncbi:DUF1963 domain-containing protein [Erythrobacter oryzae]|uniref:DUF1963 domain-containing protein n=1 Tax=Erythrobacter oryzae TaxID=3019556 RepID=UPI00255430BA|nr:DUF1963 domain-containing protein [Erythrobacter sp. COR-2]
MSGSCLFLQPLVSQSEDVAQCGHLGGNPHLAAGQAYPARDGKPYRFLLQIDCAKMPAGTWNGLMPRSGWISVFATAAGQFDVRIIYSDAAEIEHHRQDAWDPKHTSLSYLDERYHRFLEAPVAWPLIAVEAADTSWSGRHSRTGESSFRRFHEAGWPIDWDTHFLLIDEAIRSLEDRAQGFADAARQRAAKLSLPAPRLTELLSELRTLASGLVGHWTELSLRKPFSPATWRSRKDDLVRLQVLQTEAGLEQNNNDLKGFVNLARIEKANNLGTVRSLRFRSPFFAPTDHAGRSHAQILSKAEKLVAELDNDPDVPKQDPRSLSPDRVAFADYRSRYPAEWLRYKEKILEIRADFIGFWLDNQETVNELMGEWGRLPLPANWVEAIDEASQIAAWAEKELAKITAGASAADIAFIEERNEIARQSSEAALKLRSAMSDAKLQDRGATYSASDHHHLFRQIDECIGSALLRDSWNVTYETVRSEIAKRLYRHDPRQLSAPVRAHMERRWEHEAHRALIQVGGEPAGECDTLTMATEPMIMMFQIPSNDLTHFAHGDTGGLVILISEADLRDRRFDRATFDFGY